MVHQIQPDELKKTIFQFQLAASANRGPLNETEPHFNLTTYVTSDNDVSVVDDDADTDAADDDVDNDDNVQGASRVSLSDVDIQVKDDESHSPEKGHQAPELSSSPILKALTSLGQKLA